MPHEDPDSLDRDVTHLGQAKAQKSDREKSLGDQSTAGDQGSSFSDLTGDANSVDQVMEITDLAAR